LGHAERERESQKGKEKTFWGEAYHFFRGTPPSPSSKGPRREGGGKLEEKALSKITRNHTFQKTFSTKKGGDRTGPDQGVSRGTRDRKDFADSKGEIHKKQPRLKRKKPLGKKEGKKRKVAFAQEEGEPS